MSETVRAWFVLPEVTAPNGAPATAVIAAAEKKTVKTVKGCFVQALAANASPVYIGPEGVTTTTGLELGPGDSYFLPLPPDQIFCVSGAAGQKLHVAVL